MRGSTLFGLAIVGVFGAVEAVRAAARPGNDVFVSLRAAEITTAGPVATIRVTNRGTNAQTGVVVRLFANEDDTGPELWNTTVDLLPRKSVLLRRQVFVDGPVAALCATASLAGAIVDERPGDNTARVGLLRKGRVGVAFAGREAWSAHCAACHGAVAEGGAGPALVGARSRDLRAKALTGGDHDFPWLGARDGRILQTTLRSPSTIPEPEYPMPPAGGWPTYAGGVKPIFDSRCVNCHGPALAENGIRLDSFESASNFARRALFAVRTGRMPRDGPPLSADQVQLIADWIEGGRRP